MTEFSNYERFRQGLCDEVETIPYEDRLGWLSDLYDIAFGIHNHTDPDNVISTVAYHDPEGLFDQDLYGKKLKMYLDLGVNKIYSFQAFMQLTTYETRVLLTQLKKVNEKEARKPSEIKKMGAEIDAIIRNGDN